jgi:bacillithiol biosynthesis cysteine-adding enzyme BshC
MVKFVPFAKTGYFSTLICDYLVNKEVLQPFFSYLPTLENFAEQIALKKENFNAEGRNVLYNVLKQQYQHIDASQATQKNVALLKEQNTFTVTTGHQLNLFTGPLYFLYKIVSTINLCKQLKETYPAYNFVPIYWMATEDHDFDEINFFHHAGKKFQWNKNASGAVGELSTEGLEEVLKLFSQEIGSSKYAQELTQLFKESYLQHNNLADATRYLANALFAEEGLVIMDANNTQLKQLFVSHIVKELTQKTTYKTVTKSSAKLAELGYKVQVNPREINLFYIKKGLRERVVKEEGIFKVYNTAIQFTEDEILEEVKNHPERFSPNVLMRPLYQEVILPNLCYIGGGGELAYWLQLKNSFKTQNVAFPILLLRNSVLLVTNKQEQKLEKLNIEYEHLFLKRNAFINKKIREISNIDIDFTPQKEYLQEQFKSMHELAKQTDASFLGAVKAQEVKQLKGLDHLEKRLLKAQKRKLKDQVVRITALQEQLFPNESLQERNCNFSDFYLEFGPQLIRHLVVNLQPLSSKFTILKIS